MNRIINSLLIFSFIFILINCENTLENVNSNNVIIDRSVLADILGNNDGITTNDELTKLDKYFKENNIGWAVGNGYNKYGDSIPADTIKKYFELYTPLYKDSTELKRSLSTIASLATPFIGIYVLKSNKEITLIKLYRVVGNPNTGSWKEIEII